MTAVYVALGSNIEPERRLLQAAALLKQRFPAVRFSSCYQNRAVGFEGADFINAAAGFDTSLSLPALIAKLHAIEEQCGRHRDDAKWAPRAMDIDILLYGDLIDHDPAMRVPRADLLRRAYMLGPMAELAPALVHPEARRSMLSLWEELEPGAPALAKLELKLGAG